MFGAGERTVKNRDVSIWCDHQLILQGVNPAVTWERLVKRQKLSRVGHYLISAYLTECTAGFTAVKIVPH
jgi:hypothetical protein